MATNFELKILKDVKELSIGGRIYYPSMLHGLSIYPCHTHVNTIRHGQGCGICVRYGKTELGVLTIADMATRGR